MSRLRHRATVWAFLLAWRVLRLLPEGLAYRLFDLAADRTYAANSGSVQRLRAKVELDPDAPKIVMTVRGVGYRAGSVG